MTTRYPLASHTAADLLFPPEKRSLAERPAAPIARPADGPCILKFDPLDVPPDEMAWLRITAAVDHREAHRVAVDHAATGERFGQIDVLYSSAGQVFELPLTPEQVTVAHRDGLALTLIGEMQPLWIIAPGEGAHPAVVPHILAAPDRPADVERFLSLFCSTATLQPCDWMEACVLDGLRDWAMLGRAEACRALDAHLETYFLPDGTFRHENIFGHPADDQPCSEENHGPFAVLAMQRADHPALALPRRAFDQQCRNKVNAVSGASLVAETSYSVAYVMAAMARCAGDEDLLSRAIHQLRINREYLQTDDALWLRYQLTTGERMFDSWSRGVAWYFLGLVRTLALLEAGDRPDDLIDEAMRVADWVAQHQQADGVWSVFLKEASLLPDTSGSAGIAAALAMGVREGLLPERHLPMAQKACDRLMTYLTPDGWLTGVAQGNKRQTLGMDIQRARFRVIAPWGMGLFAQALAALAAGDCP